MRSMLIFLISLSLFSFVWADIGPSPTSPSITVFLNGSSASQIKEIVYNCNVSKRDSSTNIMDIRTVKFNCTNNVCQNTNWFYKLNPCFSSAGFFSYNINGKTMKTKQMNFSSGKRYDIYLNTDSGKTHIQRPGTSSTLCMIVFVIPILLGTFIGWKQ